MARHFASLSFLFLHISSTYGRLGKFGPSTQSNDCQIPGWGPPPPPDLETTLRSLRPNLRSSLPPEEFHATLNSLKNSEKLTEQLTELESLVKSRSADGLKISVAASELAELSKRPGGLREAKVGDVLEGLMAGMLRLLDFFGDSWMRYDLRPIFNALVNPLVQLAIVLNPLPEYQLTTEPMDGNMEMRFIEETFDNWGTTLLTNVTVRTFFPRTVEGVQNIVKLARQQGSRVRASGTR